MVLTVKFDLKDMKAMGKLDETVKDAYEKNDKVKFIFNVTDVSVSDAKNINHIMKIIEKHKSQEHKLESIEIICPKSHVIKRELIKKCVKMAKVKKPTYLLEK